MSFLGDSETVQILFSVDEKLRLPDGAGFSREPAEQIINLRALFGGQRQSTLLSIAVSGLGRPDGVRKISWALDPAVAGETAFRKLGRKIIGRLRKASGARIVRHTGTKEKRNKSQY